MYIEIGNKVTVYNTYPDHLLHIVIKITPKTMYKDTIVTISPESGKASWAIFEHEIAKVFTRELNPEYFL